MIYSVLLLRDAERTLPNTDLLFYFTPYILIIVEYFLIDKLKS